MFQELLNSFLNIVVFGVFMLVLLFAAIIYKRELYFRHLATYDELTGLWNGNVFRREAAVWLRKNRFVSYAMISVDIDKFKFINNSFGEKSADEILRIIAKRIRTEFDKALYARDVGDQFLIMTEDVPFLEDKLEEIAREVEFSSGLKRHSVKLPIKFGISYIGVEEGEGREEREIGEYIDYSIIARKSIKGVVYKTFAYYNNEMAREVAHEVEIEQTMDNALKNSEFVVYYQPKYDLETSGVVGAEALVRWRKPGKGMVPPDMFVPIFEKNGFVIDLDFYVYEEVMKQMNQWRVSGISYPVISVNVSRIHIGTVNFLERFITLMNRYDISAKQIELELTESALGEDTHMTLEWIKECKKAGFQISIDDFGSGYSSLNLLKEMPIDVLKIDKGFLDETEDSEKSSIIVEQVVKMAQKIHIMTICEGVETRRQAEFLKKIGCDMVQGYLYSKPLPAREFEKLL